MHVKRRISRLFAGVAVIAAASTLGAPGAAEAVIPNDGYQFTIGHADLSVQYPGSSQVVLPLPVSTYTLSPENRTAQAEFSTCTVVPATTFSAVRSYLVIANVDATLRWKTNGARDQVDVKPRIAMFGYSGLECDDDSETRLGVENNPSDLTLSYDPGGKQVGYGWATGSHLVGSPKMCCMTYGIEFTASIFGYQWGATATSDVLIPDGGVLPGVAESPLVVTGAVQSAPLQIEVDVQVFHTCRMDLVLSLIISTGQVVPVADLRGSTCANNVIDTFLVNVPPQTPLNGTWQLRVADMAAVDTGYIDHWGLRAR